MGNIKKYDEFKNNELHEEIDFSKLVKSGWENIKYGLSKLPRYKAGGKILGGLRGVDDEAKQKLADLFAQQGNEKLVELNNTIKKTAPEFPNDTKKFTFMRGIIVYGEFYDSIVAATNKSPEDDGYLAPEIANQLILGLRTMVKKNLDVDLRGVYKTFDNVRYDRITDEELNEAFIFADNYFLNEGFMDTIKGWKDKAMDKLFGSEKGSDEVKKTTGGQSAKLQQHKGDREIQSDTMDTLDSNKLPLVLAGVGTALGTLGWLAQTEWMKNLIIEYFGPDKVVNNTELITKQITGGQADSKGLIHWMSEISKAEGGGDIKTGSDITNFIKKFGGVDNMAGFFEGNGAGDALKQAKALQDAAVAGSTSGVGDIFSKATSTFGSMKGGQNLFGISTAAKFVGTSTKTVVTKTLVKGAGTAIAAKVAGVGNLLTGFGIALVSAGVVVKLLREKGKRDSRASLLNTLLQSLQLVKVPEENKLPKPSIKIGDLDSKTSKSIDFKEDGNKKEEDGNKKEVDDKSIYPLMIKNLTSLRDILINYKKVNIEGEESSNTGGNKEKSGKLVVGKIYTYTNKKGEKKKVKLISLTHDTSIGPDKKWLTSDDLKGDELSSGYVSVIFPDENGEYSSKSREIAVDVKNISESFLMGYNEFILEKDYFGKGDKATVSNKEAHLVQALTKIRKSIKVLEDEKDKGVGITVDFLNKVIEGKMTGKETIKKLYKEIWEHIGGKYKATMPQFDTLYKESLDVVNSKTKVVAEKIARFSLRSSQFKGEGLYGGLAILGDNLESFNQSFEQIMNYYKQ